MLNQLPKRALPESTGPMALLITILERREELAARRPRRRGWTPAIRQMPMVEPAATGVVETHQVPAAMAVRPPLSLLLQPCLVAPRPVLRQPAGTAGTLETCKVELQRTAAPAGTQVQPVLL